MAIKKKTAAAVMIPITALMIAVAPVSRARAGAPKEPARQGKVVNAQMPPLELILNEKEPVAPSIEEVKKRALQDLAAKDLARREEVEAFVSYPEHKIVVDKKNNLLHLFKGAQAVASYRVTRSAVQGNRRVKGDMKTPEGIFPIETAGPETVKGWTLWMGLNTAAAAKRDFARLYGAKGAKMIDDFERRRGPIVSDLHVKKGFNPLAGPDMWSGLGIHGGGNVGNWTRGCIAMEDRDVKELHRHLRTRTGGPIGTHVMILP